jgi:hypothetical protein
MKKRLKTIVALLLVLVLLSGVTFYLQEAKILADATNPTTQGLSSNQVFPNVPTDASLPAGNEANIDQSKVWDLYAKATKVVDFDALVAKSSYTGSDQSTRYVRFQNQSVDSIIQNAVADQFYWMALKSTYTTYANAMTTKPNLTTQAKVNSYIAGRTGMERATTTMLNFVYGNRNNLPLVLASIDHPEVRYNYETAALLDELGIYQGVSASNGITSDNITTMLSAIPATQIIYTDGTLPFVARFYSIVTAQASATTQAAPTKNYASTQTAYAASQSAAYNQANINMATAASWTNISVSTAIYPQYDSAFFNKDLLSGTNAQNLAAEMASYQIADPQGSEIKLGQLVNGTDPATNNFAKNINQNSSVITSFLNNQPSEKNYAFTQTAQAAVLNLQSLATKAKTALTSVFGLFTHKNAPAQASEKVTASPKGLTIDPQSGVPSVNATVYDLSTGLAAGTLIANAQTHELVAQVPGLANGSTTMFYDSISGATFALSTTGLNSSAVLLNAQSQLAHDQGLVNSYNPSNPTDQPGYELAQRQVFVDNARVIIATALANNEGLNDNTIKIIKTKSPNISLVVSKAPVDVKGQLKAIIKSFSPLFRIDPLTGKAEIGYANKFGSGIFMNSDAKLVGTYSLHSVNLNNTMLYADSGGMLALGQKFALGSTSPGSKNSAIGSITIDAKGNISGAIDITKIVGVKMGYGVGLAFDKKGLSGVTIPFGSIGSLGHLKSGFGIGIDMKGNLSFSVFIMVGPIPVSITLGMDSNQNLRLSWLGGNINISRLFGWQVKDPRPRTKPNPSTTDSGSMDFSTFWFPTTVTNASTNVGGALCKVGSWLTFGLVKCSSSSSSIPFTTKYTVWNEVASSNTADQQTRAQIIVGTYKELIYRPPTQTEFANLYFYTGNSKVGDITWADHYAATENAAIAAITNIRTNKCTKSVADSTLQGIISAAITANGGTASTSTTTINSSWACAIKATNQTLYKDSDFNLANWLTDMQQQAEQNQTTNNTTPIATPVSPSTGSGNNNSANQNGSTGLLGGSTLISTGLSLMAVVGITILILAGIEVWQYEKKKKPQKINLPPQ